MTDISESHVCYLCRGYLHVDGDLVLTDVMIIRVGLQPRELVPVHSWCKRQRLEEYENKVSDPQATFARYMERNILPPRHETLQQ